ncbi:hypothetical protein B0E41_01795 [Hydrogenophaga sp. A37]|nr:hypothetical protein B0E41_01795 [Hydrogenophaga sp. A37]
MYSVSIDYQLGGGPDFRTKATCSDKTPGLGITVDLDTASAGRSITACAASPSDQRTALISDDEVSVSDLYIEKAVIQKTLADELFLTAGRSSDRRDEAKKKYQAARLTALEAGRVQVQELAPSTRATQRLLLADIDYRLLLISAGIDFWGGYRGKSPGVPIRHLIALEDLVNEFDRVITQIDALGSDQADADKEILKAKAALAELNGKLRAYVTDKERGVVLEKRERKTIDMGSRRLSAISQAQTQISQRMDALAAQQESLQKQASALITRAVVSASGIDPAVVEGLRQGDIKAVASAYITSELAAPDSEISQAIAGVSRESAKFVDLYREAKTRLEDAQELRSDLESAAEVVRNPTAENIRRLGAAVYERLPPAKRAELENGLRDKIAGVEWVRAVERTAKSLKVDEVLVRREVALAIQRSGVSADQVRRMVGPALQASIKLEGEATPAINRIFAEVQRDLLVAGKRVEDVNLGLHAIMTAAPEEFVKSVPPELRALLRAHLKVADDKALALALARGMPSDLRVALASADRIVLESTRLSQKVELLRSQVVVDKPISGAVEQSLAQCTRMLDAILDSASARTDVVLSSLPLDSLKTQVTILREPNIIASMRDALVGVLPNEAAKSDVSKAVMSGAIGSAYMEDAILGTEGATPKAEQAPASPPVTQSPDQSTDSGLDPAANAALTAALNAAFPGAGVALQLAQSFAAASANAALLDSLADESARLMAEKVELSDRLTEKYFDAVLAQKDQERAEALADASREQVSLYQTLMEKSVEEANTDDLKIGLRRGWAYYLAERMREEFDLFDRSFALWSQGEAAQGVVEDEIRNDPQNVRYALDNDIHLYDWLNRSRESTRTDPDLLRVHWSRMLRLAKDVCQRRGCKPGDGLLGQVGATRNIGLATDLLPPDEVSRFRTWQRSPVGRFQADVFLSPIQSVVPLGLENLRVVDIRVSAKKADGNLYAAGPISIRHLGVAYIPRIKRTPDEPASLTYQIETYAARATSSFNTVSEFDLNALRTRYDSFFTGSNLPSARALEGYGLYGRYSIALEPTSENLSAQDVVLRFAYFYQDPTNVSSERQFVSELIGGGAYADTSSLELIDDNSQCQEPGVSGVKRRTRGTSAATFAFFSGRTPSPVRGAVISQGERGEIERLQQCARIKVHNNCSAERNSLDAATTTLGRRSFASTKQRQDFDGVSLFSADQRSTHISQQRLELQECLKRHRAE